MATAEDRLWRDARLNAGCAGGVAVAKRYSGDVAVTIVYRDRDRDYACRVVSPDGQRIVFVGAPRLHGYAVDSKEAFDSVARAAIAFAEFEGLSVQALYDEQLTEIQVTGKPVRRTS